jgi:anaerobic magnesium-protoporphyrin IX monomethyl ester cyclase
MEKKSILLFYPKTSENSSWYRAPLSLLTIASQIDKNKYEIIIIDANIESNYKKKIEELLYEKKNLLCVGISAMTGLQIKGALEISRLVKSINPTLPVVWGGWHCSILPDETLKSKYIDFVVRAQGEITFKELINALEKGKEFENIDGLSFKKSNRIKGNKIKVNQIVHNKKSEFLDINSFLPIDYDLVDIEKYIIKTDFGKRTINYITSQGCPYDCGFCAEVTVNNRRWSGLSSDRVLDEIEKLVKKYNVDGIIFDDNSLFVNNKRVLEICSGILKRKLNIKWGQANGRTDQLLKLSDEEWNLLKESGCTSILIGAESGSDKILKLINKKVIVENTIDVLKKAKKYGISIEASLMAGFPEEPEQDLNKTLDLIDLTYGISPNHKALLFFYTPYPGTPLFDMAVKNGLKVPRNLEMWSSYDLEHANTPWLSASYRRKLRSIISCYLPLTFLSKNARKIIKKGGIKGKALKIMNKLAVNRWKRRNFSFPLEYYLFSMFRKFI